MSFKSWPAWTSLFLLMSLSSTSGGVNYNPTPADPRIDQEPSSPTNFITAEELKAKLAKNEAVTIIDVRSANGIDDNKIKGAVYVKLRRLKYRLAFPPLKDVPRDRDVVTYCACPNDEASVRAAQVLRESGFTRVHVLKGGWVIWKKANGQIERTVRGV
ncbi:MAG TPA: rhodanese-like domain-containing protein [Pyrinomonadaceae bacterium]|nr:rhodanese-like domain-containing protein [Pyrinomonadaceae bacterium]